MLTCERCFRSIGLWLYENDLDIDNNYDNESTALKSYTVDLNEDSGNIFANTQPYFDEIVVKTLLENIVNQIGIEQENVLKDRVQSETYKRKLTRETDSNKEERSSKKELNPIREHFSWCP